MKELLGSMALAIFVVVIGSLVVSYPVMLLWNGCLVGAIESVRTITWLQGWGIMILFGILFKPSVTTKK
jgi:hypothetical protein